MLHVSSRFQLKPNIAKEYKNPKFQQFFPYNIFTVNFRTEHLYKGENEANEKQIFDSTSANQRQSSNTRIDNLISFVFIYSIKHRENYRICFVKIQRCYNTRQANQNELIRKLNVIRTAFNGSCLGIIEVSS